MTQPNWKELFNKKFYAYRRNGTRLKYPMEMLARDRGIKAFISTEIIEKLINDIPEFYSIKGEFGNIPMETLKQQLKNKWL